MSIRTEQHEEILLVILDRPEARNAINLEMSRTLWDTWRAFQKDRDLRVAIITGAGDKAFCAGADLKEIRPFYEAMTPIERREKGETEPGLGGITRNLDPGKPVIAAINGHCLAGGLELALACDIRIAASHAVFGLPEVRWGIMPGAGGTQRLPRLIPFGIAMELILTGESMDAETALRYGLVNRVVPAERLLPEAINMAKRIASCAPLAVQAARHAARRGIHLPLDEGLRLEQFYAEPLRQTEDAKEGLRAFQEKRRPVFRGR